MRAGEAHVQLRRRGNNCLRGVSRASQERRAALWVLEIERRDLKGGGGGERPRTVVRVSHGAHSSTSRQRASLHFLEWDEGTTKK